ncbi:hypothetical protein M426DRAFT_23348 [Hypoxylon sp. CI-4A]|nr:hypothetical protein M426DRAFT_23348 [Hypoxylon sp. CI-4A]
MTIENIAVREDGGLLVTLFHPSASVYTMERPFSDSPSMHLVHTIPDANCTTGIAEVSPNTFVVANVFLEDAATPYLNTTAFWELKWNGYGQAAATRRIARVPEARLINGIAPIPSLKPAVLAVDCLCGVILRVDVGAGGYETVLDVPELKPVSGGPFDLGANGIQIRDGYVYWSNSELHPIYRVQIDGQGYPIKGAKVETVTTVKDTIDVDDFTFDRQGNIWAATNFNNTVVTIDTDGYQRVAVGSNNDLTVAGDTAVGFGRTLADEDILYVTTSGAATFPINGTVVEPGNIVAIDARGNVQLCFTCMVNMRFNHIE